MSDDRLRSDLTVGVVGGMVISLSCVLIADIWLNLLPPLAPDDGSQTRTWIVVAVLFGGGMLGGLVGYMWGQKVVPLGVRGRIRGATLGCGVCLIVLAMLDAGRPPKSQSLLVGPALLSLPIAILVGATLGLKQEAIEPSSSSAVQKVQDSTPKL